jgi:hypothetical protein
LKKPNGSVRFWFYKPKTEKTEPSRAKLEKTEPNRFEPVFVLKNQTEPKQVGLNRFRFGFFFFKIRFSYFFYKNRTEPKMIENDQPYT